MFTFITIKPIFFRKINASIDNELKTDENKYLF
jgi:hypothetical protein